jgi:hypothetical protein
MSRTRVVLGSIALGASSVGALVTFEPVHAAPPPCHRDYCVDDEITLPGEGPSGPAPGGGGATPVRTAPRCIWVKDPGPITGGDGTGSIPDIGPRRSNDDYLLFEVCDGEATGRMRWASPAVPTTATPPVATPDQLAATVRVRLEGNLPAPTITTSPRLGEAAVVDHPTFLAVDNWAGTISDRECELVLCATVTAVPTLTWSPGEPDADTLTCSGPGTRFDPSGPTPQLQAAADGACAHAYRQRTRVPGRPDFWPGVATVTWALTWTSTSGTAGDLPAIVRTTDVPRAIDEVQGIVDR